MGRATRSKIDLGTDEVRSREQDNELFLLFRKLQGTVYGGGIGFLIGNTESFSSADTVATDTSLAICDTTSAAFTLTLFTPTTNRIVSVKNIGTKILTIDTAGAELIDGNASIQLISQYDAVILHFDGTNWHII